MHTCHAREHTYKLDAMTNKTFGVRNQNGAPNLTEGKCIPITQQQHDHLEDAVHVVEQQPVHQELTIRERLKAIPLLVDLRCWKVIDLADTLYTNILKYIILQSNIQQHNNNTRTTKISPFCDSASSMRLMNSESVCKESGIG